MADTPSGSSGGRRSLTRKQVLIGGGAVAVLGGGAAAGIVLGTRGGGGEDYPRAKIASKSQLQTDKPVSFEYPLKGQASVLIDLGQQVPGGVGDKSSIVAYSALCQHMGCEVPYDEKEQHFQCPCHQTKYDPAREGFVIQGVAQRPLPRIALELDGDDIFAVGVDGLIYGYRDNLSPGEKVA
jgi:arsenite oxidase small subunit